MAVAYTEILRTDCLGDSRIKINDNFDAFKIAANNLRSRVIGGSWIVNLGDALPILGSECIGDSLLTINQNISLIKEAFKEIQTQAGSLLSACSSFEFDEITQINGNECIGDSRNKLNFIFGFLSSIENCFNSILPPVPPPPTPTPTPTETPTPYSNSY